MSDLISRQAALDAIFSEPLYESGMKKRDADAVVPAIYEKIKSFPSAQPERKTGRWIYGEDDVAMCDGYHCSECGFFVPWDYKRKFIDFIKDYNFCPSCGSPMLKEGE